MPTGGGGGGGGLSTVSTNSTLTGNGTSGSPLAVAAPYNRAAPGALGGITSDTGQFTNVAIGTSPPTLDGTTGDLTIAGGFATGGNATSGTAGDINIARVGANANGIITLGNGNSQVSIVGEPDSASNAACDANGWRMGNVYFTKRNVNNFSDLPAASATYKGALAWVQDSTTVVWGATITGGGSNMVLAFCDGTNWTVAAK